MKNKYKFNNLSIKDGYLFFSCETDQGICHTNVKVIYMGNRYKVKSVSDFNFGVRSAVDQLNSLMQSLNEFLRLNHNIIPIN